MNISLYGMIEKAKRKMKPDTATMLFTGGIIKVRIT